MTKYVIDNSFKSIIKDILKIIKEIKKSQEKLIIKLFKSNGYDIYLVDEYRTSCKSFINGNSAEKFLMKANHRHHREGLIMCCGLLRSKIFTNEKSNDKYVLLNRDFNGAMNILKKGRIYRNIY